MIAPHGGRLIERIAGKKEKEDLLSLRGKYPEIEISRELAFEVENIAIGLFSPLEGFLGKEDFHSVLKRGRLASDIPWTIPIVLDVDKEKAREIGEGLFLLYERKLIAWMEVQEKYTYDKEEMAYRVYGTLSEEHPGVVKVKSMKDILVGGKITLLNHVSSPFPKYKLTPKETRVLFETKGWRRVVGFQTRNVPHLGHEYVQKTALTFVDGLFINPVIGKKKKGDFKDEVIIKAYEALFKHYYLPETATMAILQMEMRYAGPREAIHHAIIRKNYGCTHFIVGRDHAGVGNFYSPYAAQEIFDDYPDLGIIPLFFRSFFYCKKCGGVVNEKICPHEEEHRISFSGTKIRALLMEGKIPSAELMRPEVAKVITEFDNPFV